jgi:predicted dehydrogenase
VGEACHFIDLLVYLAGVPPVEVYAQTLPDSGRYRRDNVSAQIQFGNGAIGTLHYLANGDQRMSKERLEVSGGGAGAIIDDFRRATFVRGGRIRRMGHWWSGQDKGHQGELCAFVQAVRESDQSPVPFGEAVLSMTTTFAIQRSLEAGAPIRV